MIGARLMRESFCAVGTECAVAVTATRSDARRARRAMSAAIGEIASCERVLTRFHPGGDLSRLNAAAGEWLRVDRRLIEALRCAVRVREATDGRFDPTILPVLLAAGYDRSFEDLAERPPSVARGWRPGAMIEIDVVSSRARLEAGAAVDLGGIGKGFAAARALEAMRDAWSGVPGGMVDLGGDIAVWGATPEGGPWRLSIADPRVSGATLATIAIHAGAVATSGPQRRRFGPGGRLHHLIDPSTGAPAAAGPLAVTVVGPDASEVEAFATALAITPPDEAPAALALRPRMSALVVPPEGDPVVIGSLPLAVDPRLMEVIA